MTIWFASGNEHKVIEIKSILQGYEVKTPADLGIAFDPEENGSDFLQNALIKARALFQIVREPVIADDSGLCVDALDGRPGVRSARYGGENGVKISAEERNALLLKEIGNEAVRTARFVCSMVLLTSPDRFFAVQETLEGEVVRSGRGAGGFGYDPILFLPDRGMTVAQLSDGEKNAISHRGKAARAIARFLDPK